MMNSVSGQNTDILLKGENLHIQTEDWGTVDRVLVSRIFNKGRVIKTYKLSYEKINNSDDKGTRQAALNRFHKMVLESLQKLEI